VASDSANGIARRRDDASAQKPDLLNVREDPSPAWQLPDGTVARVGSDPPGNRPIPPDTRRVTTTSSTANSSSFEFALRVADAEAALEHPAWPCGWGLRV